MQEVFVVGDQPLPGYKLLENVGGSAFYRIWKVKDPRGATMMWKEIDLVVGNAAVETRTLSLLVELRHPYLNTLTNFWELNEGKTLVIETDLPLESLKDRLERAKDGLPIEEIHQFMRNAAEGLDFLNKPQHHFQGETVAIYHRALRPDCLLLFEEGGKIVCKVSDFGLAKPVTEQTAGHSQGLMHYDYDPPEFFEGQTAPTSDQYALAINYYQLRTGSLPFSGTMLEQLQARLNDRPSVGLVNESEQAVLRKALSRDPMLRFPSCLELAESLRLASEGQAVATSRLTPRASAPLRSNLASSRDSGFANPKPISEKASIEASSVTPGAGQAEKQDIPGVVFHRRPDDANRPAVAQAKSDNKVEDKQPSKPTSPNDLRSFRDKLTESPGQVAEVDDSAGEGTIPIFWVLMILLAFVAVAAYFLSTSSLLTS